MMALKDEGTVDNRPPWKRNPGKLVGLADILTAGAPLIVGQRQVQMADVLKRLEALDSEFDQMRRFVLGKPEPLEPDKAPLDFRVLYCEEKVKLLRADILAIEKRLEDAYQEPEACRKHQCSYYKHYLAYGPAELTHEGYHAAEEHVSQIAKELRNHIKGKEHIRGGDCPGCDRFAREIEPWEKRVRA